MSITLITDKKKITYADATHMYEKDGSYMIANAGIEQHGNNVIYAIVSAATPCVIQNDDASPKQARPGDPVQQTIDIFFNPILKLEVPHARLVRMKKLLNEYNTKTQKWKP